MHDPENGATRQTVPAGVAQLDRLSEELLRAASFLRVALAATDAEREATYRLRYEQVVAGGWARRDELPAQLEHDAYDAEALHVGAWDAGALAGTVRLVLPAPPSPATRRGRVRHRHRAQGGGRGGRTPRRGPDLPRRSRPQDLGCVVRPGMAVAASARIHRARRSRVRSDGRPTPRARAAVRDPGAAAAALGRGPPPRPARPSPQPPALVLADRA